MAEEKCTEAPHIYAEKGSDDITIETGPTPALMSCPSQPVLADVTRFQTRLSISFPGHVSAE